jgi:two-component sensor histidine kinase
MGLLSHHSGRLMRQESHHFQENPARRDTGDRLLVHVADEGVGLRPRADSPGLGLGLGLMAQMADDFAITHRHELRGTIVSLRFALGGREPEADTAAAPRTGGSAAGS